MTHSSFIAELQRRNVLRAAALYVGASWALSQGLAQLLPVFDIPNWVTRWFVVAALIGFPFAILFSWFYEWTPQGIRRESDVVRNEDGERAPSNTVAKWLFACVCLAAVLLLANAFVPHKDAAPVPASPANAPAPAPSAKSIAVLPFANLSADASNAFFATGIQDEILTRLSKIASMKVISRTSTQRYGAAPDNLPEIARQLGVSNLVEGSVQRSGDKVRINVQLIEAASDSHLWAETYDRTLTDVFGVESEVAEAIAHAMQATLTGNEKEDLARKLTTNAAAYSAYLHGLALEAHGFSGAESSRTMAAFFAQAVQLDPAFALAWAHLAVARSYMLFNHYDRTPELEIQAKDAADEALSLQPSMGEAYWALGMYRYWGLEDFDGGLKALQKAHAWLPNSASILHSISLIERRQGKWKDAVAHATEAAVLDPRSISVLTSLATYQAALREIPAALDTIERAIGVAPDDMDLISLKAALYQSDGNLDAAEALLAPFPVQPDGFQLYNIQVQQLFYRRRYDEVVRTSREGIARLDNSDAFAASSVYGNLGFALLLSGDTTASHSAFGEAIKRLQPMQGDAAGFPLASSYVALSYAGIGDRTAALREAARGVSRAAMDAVFRPQAEIMQAQVQANVGEIDAAIRALPHLLEIPGGVTLALLRLDPLWDPLRKDPRFQTIVDAR